MDDQSSLLALLGTVDRTLADQGVDPEIVTEEDKILIATQYVEAAGVREKMTITVLEEHPCARLFHATP